MSPSMVNAVYYPSWGVYGGKPPSCLDAAAITHVFYAFVRVNENGTLRLLDEFGDLVKDVDGEKGCLAALGKFKRQHPHIKTLVSLGGGSGSAEFPKLAASETARETFATEARSFCDRYGFDGIDIDWEHPQTPTQGLDYVRLLESARSTLPPSKYLLSTALPVGEYSLGQIDLESAARLLDFLNLMCYDFVGGWTNSCSGGVEYLLSRNVPSHKILLGIPTYARYFPHAQGPGQSSLDAGEMDIRALPDAWFKGASASLPSASSLTERVSFSDFITSVTLDRTQTRPNLTRLPKRRCCFKLSKYSQGYSGN
ncbi:glycosyl hydrolases family 18 domain-containing protein [Hirsutella rhossiliensis]|uniref:chitinase n=1 Tax=Hirsutella rhossiliensis TaxID=111463 RepID=A0A9P8SN43_9HYPO|nr:glycosyl hydrolases family 18 domain-containing protein [Hirsutella rhossiliensis]KAH0967984.1 glycosyl hydrolases family 18 domain-containing protein [Hirsutella rhossiliensis]